MGKLIGYKGSPTEREATWNTLLKLRKSIAYSKTDPKFEECLWMEKRWYKEEFDNYLAA